jgi:hypothetical protein
MCSSELQNVEIVIVLYLFVITTCKLSISLFTNPNPSIITQSRDNMNVKLQTVRTYTNFVNFQRCDRSDRLHTERQRRRQGKSSTFTATDARNGQEHTRFRHATVAVLTETLTLHIGEPSRRCIVDADTSFRS